MPEQFLHGIETIEIPNGTYPIQTVKSSVIGLIGTAPDADANDFPLNVPVLLTNQRTKAATLGDNGTLKDAMADIYRQAGASVVIVRVDEGVDEATTLSNIVGDATAETGVHAFMKAQSTVHVTPRILIAPGFTSQRPGDTANPVVAELQGIATKLRSIIFADGPGTTDADAITYRDDFDASGRIMVIDPHVQIYDTETSAPVDRPASASVAGRLSWIDNNKGFWHSISNHVLAGVVGVARPISFNVSDPNSQANHLNENRVTTIIQNNGFRVWGNRTATIEPLNTFLSVRRTIDMVIESIEHAHLWALDRPISAQLLKDVVESVSAYLRDLKSRGAILGGRAWIDPELNSPTRLQAGEVTISFDIEPPAPMEKLVFNVHRNNGYYEEVLETVSRDLENA